MRKPILALALLVAPLVLWSCGIEEYLYLEAPSVSSSGTALAFTHSTTNTASSFLGYEIYYKIYPGTSSTEAPSAATADVSAIASKVSAAPGADQVVTYLQSTKGFSRMNQSATSPVASSGTPPFVQIDAGDVSKAGVITALDLGAGSATLSVSGTDTTFYFSRSVGYRPFTDFTYDSGDCDATNNPGTGNAMATPWLVAYVVAYALGNDFVAAYSYPRLLTVGTDSSGPLYIGDLN